MLAKPANQSASESLKKLEEGIRTVAKQHIGNALSGTHTARDPYHSNLVDQLTDQALERAHEMLIPVLTWVRAAGLDETAAMAGLQGHDFSVLLEYWTKFVSARCSAVQDQLFNAKKLLGKPIVAVAVLNGDPHNGGYQPLKLTTEKSGVAHDFLYKSIDSTATKLVQRAAAIISARLGIGNFVDEVDESSKGAYLRRFAAVSKPENQIEIEQYFYIYGVICSVASFLEITDLHFENIITTRAGPRLIDIEFTLSCTQYQKFKWSYKNSGLFESGTSPIGQTSKHLHLQPFHAISDNRISYRHLQSVENSSHIVLTSSGRPVDVSDFAGFIERGARDADFAIQSSIENIYSALHECLKEDHNLRCWIRGTAFYKAIQVQLWLPHARLSDQIQTTKNKLYHRKTISASIPEEAKIKIVDAEIHDLLKGDIPYFWINGASGDLMHSTGTLYKKWGLSSIEALACRKNHWSIRHYSRDMAPIIRRMSMHRPIR